MTTNQSNKIKFDVDKELTSAVSAPYVLLALHELGGSATAKECADKITQDFWDVSDELFEKKTSTGALLVKNKIDWAREYLKKAGFLDGSVRGIWQLTDEGKSKVPELKHMEFAERKEFGKNIEKDVRKLQPKRKNQSDATERTTDTADEPQEVEPVNYLQEDLKIIQSMDPYAFERLCAKLLRAVGYVNVETTRKSADGGYDGVGYLKIGLVKFKVIIQSKRYNSDSKISSDKIRELSGTKGMERAEKAIFITTSDFTKQARADALTSGIDLINGEDLVSLLYKHEIGCTKRLDKAAIEDI